MGTGMGYRFSHTNWKISTAGASNIVTRLASRTVTGHELPIHVHQHYALEFHLVPNPNTNSCIRRRFLNERHARELCDLLIDSAMSGLCSCLFNDRGDLIDTIEHCFRAEPIEVTTTSLSGLCDCDVCTLETTEELEDARWRSKVVQQTKKQTDICSCRQITDHCETMYHFAF